MELEASLGRSRKTKREISFSERVVEGFFHKKKTYWSYIVTVGGLNYVSLKGSRYLWPKWFWYGPSTKWFCNKTTENLTARQYMAVRNTMTSWLVYFASRPEIVRAKKARQTEIFTFSKTVLMLRLLEVGKGTQLYFPFITAVVPLAWFIDEPLLRRCNNLLKPISYYTIRKFIRNCWSWSVWLTLSFYTEFI